MVRMLNAHKWDALAWNFRGCSGEMNRQARFYHSGATDDLDTVVQYALHCDCYESVALIGFSLGGNLTLKYLGEKGRGLAPAVKKAVVFSVPLCLAGSCDTIARPGNYIYSKRFLNSLHRKVQSKSALMPGHTVLGAPRTVRSIKDFDDLLHGAPARLRKRRRLLRGVQRQVVPQGHCHPDADRQRQERPLPLARMLRPQAGGRAGKRVPRSAGRRRPLRLCRPRPQRPGLVGTAGVGVFES
jgi:dienelactone hydrolase